MKPRLTERLPAGRQEVNVSLWLNLPRTQKVSYIANHFWVRGSIRRRWR